MTRVSKRIEILAEKKFEEEKASAAVEESSQAVEREMEPPKLKESSKFNEGLWTEIELTALLESIKKHNWCEWDAISEEIQTRSPSQVANKLAKYSNGPSTKPSSIAAQLSSIVIQKRKEHKQLGNKHMQPDSIKTVEPKGIIEPDTEPIKAETETIEAESQPEPETVEATLLMEAETEIFEVKNAMATMPMEVEPETIKSEKIEAAVPMEVEPVEMYVTLASASESMESESVILVPIEDVPIKSVSMDAVDEIVSESMDVETGNAERNEGSVHEISDGVMSQEQAPIEDEEKDNKIPKDSESKVQLTEDALMYTAVEKAASANESADADSDSKPASKKTYTRKIATKIAKSPIKSPKPEAVPAGAVTKKRAYNRKTISRPTTPVSASEEVSILSSSPSEGSVKDSINIMSSSDSNTSTPKSIESIKSSKSDNSIKSGKSAKSDKSTKSTTSSTSNLVVEKWEKEACPAIFDNASVLNQEKRYVSLRTAVMKMIKNNPEYSKEDIIEKYKVAYSFKAIEQVIEILGFNKSTKAEEAQNEAISEVKAEITEIPSEIKSETVKTSSKKKAVVAAESNEELELLKKLSSTSSGRKRKIRTEEGDWIDPNEIEGRVISHVPVKEKRKRKTPKKEPFTEDLNSSEDPFRLILLNDYDDETKKQDHSHSHSHSKEDEDDEPLIAPFKVEICTSVILLMDMHSHMHSSEIIGLLGGTFDTTSEVPVLKIDFGFPCSTAHSTGTQVDVDPLSEMEAGEYFESNQVRMAGWYHSHPNFEPNPSVRDLETQIMYQGLLKNSQPNSDIEPFVGVIVNPYLAITESSSHVECFYVAPNTDPNLTDDDRIPYRIPIKRKPFNPTVFPEILSRMREIIFQADSSSDRLDMNKNAQPGVKRIEKLFKSLQFHSDLNPEQMEQIEELFK